jgi:hypothetical protein
MRVIYLTEKLRSTMKTILFNLKYFIKNYYFVYFKSENKPKSFAGYGRYWLAKKYADKRTASTATGVTGRKRHFCFPYADNIVLVCNRTEVNGMIKKKMIHKSVDINYMINNAFYISK